MNCGVAFEYCKWNTYTHNIFCSIWWIQKLAQKIDGGRFNFRKLNELQVRKEHHIEISNRFEPLKNLSDSEDINRAWENIKENIKTSVEESLGLYELKQHKPWFDEECLGFFYIRWSMIKCNGYRIEVKAM